MRSNTTNGREWYLLHRSSIVIEINDANSIKGPVLLVAISLFVPFFIQIGTRTIAPPNPKAPPSIPDRIPEIMV